jgi:hypothetical protein
MQWWRVVSYGEVMKSQYLFASLVAIQAVHSFEETWFGLYDRLPYIAWIDQLIAGGAMVSFIAANTAFVVFGCWCYVARVRYKAAGANFFVMLWIIVEVLNGILHPAWSLIAGGYVPGTITAPLLLLCALLLRWRWVVERQDLPLT